MLGIAAMRGLGKLLDETKLDALIIFMSDHMTWSAFRGRQEQQFDACRVWLRLMPLRRMSRAVLGSFPMSSCYRGTAAFAK